MKKQSRHKYASILTAVAILLHGNNFCLADELGRKSAKSITSLINAAQAKKEQGDLDGAYLEWRKIY